MVRRIVCCRQLDECCTGNHTSLVTISMCWVRLSSWLVHDFPGRKPIGSLIMCCSSRGVTLFSIIRSYNLYAWLWLCWHCSSTTDGQLIYDLVCVDQIPRGFRVGSLDISLIVCHALRLLWVRRYDLLPFIYFLLLHCVNQLFVPVSNVPSPKGSLEYRLLNAS